MPLNLGVKAIGLDITNERLLLAAPRILATNRAMVDGLLAEIKAEVALETPLGPGHFGYHLRDSFTTDVSSRGVVTRGVLKSPPTGYWREYGTLDRFRRADLGTKALRLGRTSLTAHESRLGGLFGASGGERAFMTAHHAAAAAQRYVRIFYGTLTNWWRAK